MNTRTSVRIVRALMVLTILFGLSQIVSGVPAGYRLPFTGFAYITQAPGCGTHIGDGPGEAIDFRLYYQPVYADKAGRVYIIDEEASEFGRRILLYHEDGRRSYYGHLQKFLVVDGVYVEQGELIAISGNTGTSSSGPHLHFQINNQETNKGIPIRDLPWIFWYSTNPDNLCVAGYHGEAVAPPVSAKPVDSPGYYARALVNSLRVRLEPGTSSPATGTLPLYSIGLLVPNEQNGVYADGYYWWNVHFKTDRCLRGWSAARTAGGEEWIEIINTHPPVGQGSSFQHLFVDAYTRVYGQESCGYQLFGYAINSVHSWGNGLIQDFYQENNELAIMKPSGKNEAYGIYGALWAKYKAMAPFGYLGYPVSDERGTRSGAQGLSTTGRLQDFESGHLYYHKDGQRAGQTFEIHGAIDTVYLREGGNNGWLGFPISDEFTNTSGYPQNNFEGGYITTLDGITYRAFAWGVSTTTPVLSKTPTTTSTVTVSPGFTNTPPASTTPTATSLATSTKSPTPSPDPSLTPGAISIVAVWTTNESNLLQSLFARGESIRYWFETEAQAQLQGVRSDWLVQGACGPILSETWSLNIPQARSRLALQRSIPEDACLGAYTFQLTLTYNNQSISKATSFSVVAQPPTSTPTLTATATSSPTTSATTTPSATPSTTATSSPSATPTFTTTPEPTVTPGQTATPPICYDFNGDGIVDMDDVQLVATSWRAPNSAYDLNEDNQVTIQDIMLVAKSWGDVCPRTPTATCCAPPPTPPPVLEPSATCACPGPPTEVPVPSLEAGH